MRPVNITISQKPENSIVAPIAIAETKANGTNDSIMGKSSQRCLWPFRGRKNQSSATAPMTSTRPIADVIAAYG